MADQTPDHNATDTSLADLGLARFNEDVAAVDRADHALHVRHPITVAQGRAPPGLEAQVFAWNAFTLIHDDRDAVAEAKGDLHGGQLHRANREAERVRHVDMMAAVDVGDGRVGRGGGSMRGKRGGSGGRGFGYNSEPVGPVFDDPTKPIYCGRKPSEACWPNAKGMKSKSMAHLFYGPDEMIVTLPAQGKSRGVKIQR